MKIKEKILTKKELNNILVEYPNIKIFDIQTKKYILLYNYIKNESRK